MQPSPEQPARCPRCGWQCYLDRYDDDWVCYACGERTPRISRAPVAYGVAAQALRPAAPDRLAVRVEAAHGLTVAQLMETFSATEDMIRRCLEPGRGKRGALSGAEVQDIQRLLQEQVSYTEIALRVGRSLTVVSRVAHGHYDHVTEEGVR